MKKTALILASGLALAASAQAGPSYSAKGKEVIPPPPAPCLWSWFAGGSAGYTADDWDEDIYTLHFGAEYKCPGSNSSHAVFLEVGYTDKNESFDLGGLNDFGDDLNFDVDIIPITLNYKYETTLTGNLNWYIGAGVGIAIWDGEASLRGLNTSEKDTVFYGHVFTGLVYNVSESFEIFGGAKYIFMDDPDFFAGSPIEDDFSLDGDIHFEVGVRFNF